MLAKALRWIGSLRLTVTLLALSMVLVFAGTLAQVDQGLWVVMDRYFRCVIAWIDLPIFFPFNGPVPNFAVPFPGGFLLGGLLVVNLLAAHWARFKIQTTGLRRATGWVMLLIGVLVTVGVLLGWGTAPVAATENDAFWRVFWRLGRSGVAAGFCYVACALLYRRNAGLVLLHGGIILLLAGEFATALFAEEASVTIREGETVDYVTHARKLELALIETSQSDFDTVTVIPEKRLKRGRTLRVDELPFDLHIKHVMANSAPPQRLKELPDVARETYPAYAGVAAEFYFKEQSQDQSQRSFPAIDLEIVDRETGASIGRYLVSLFFGPDFLEPRMDWSNRVSVDGKEYLIYLRHHRDYLVDSEGNPYTLTLLDFVHETYEGTSTPKNFSSQVRLQNRADDIDRELRIWMNNPLRYAHRTFYQSGYLPDNSGTILHVVRNDTWMVPYIACMFVLVGMTAQFVQSLNKEIRRAR